MSIMNSSKISILLADFNFGYMPSASYIGDSMDSLKPSSIYPILTLVPIARLLGNSLDSSSSPEFQLKSVIKELGISLAYF